MTLNMTADFLKNGSNMVKIQLQEDSAPFQVKVFGMMMRVEVIGDLSLFMLLILKRMYIPAHGMMIKMAIASLQESTCCLMLKIQESLLKE